MMKLAAVMLRSSLFVVAFAGSAFAGDSGEPDHNPPYIVIRR